jgi:hypothetical protein
LAAGRRVGGAPGGPGGDFGKDQYVSSACSPVSEGCGRADAARQLAPLHAGLKTKRRRGSLLAQQASEDGVPRARAAAAAAADSRSGLGTNRFRPRGRTF